VAAAVGDVSAAAGSSCNWSRPSGWPGRSGPGTRNGRKRRPACASPPPRRGAAGLRRKVTRPDGPLPQVQAVLVQTIAGVLQKRIDPRQGTAVAALSTALVRVYELGEQEAALADALERLAALERSGGGVAG
jgi:hypothetical protein